MIAALRLKSRTTSFFGSLRIVVGSLFHPVSLVEVIYAGLKVAHERTVIGPHRLSDWGNYSYLRTYLFQATFRLSAQEKPYRIEKLLCICFLRILKSVILRLMSPAAEMENPKLFNLLFLFFPPRVFAGTKDLASPLV